MTAPDIELPAEPVNLAAAEARAVRALVNASGPGWTYRLTRARGPLDVTALSDTTDGNGKRNRVTRTETVDSIVARGQHTEHGRAVVALWVHREGRWTLDCAWRGRHDDEQTPVQLTATELKAYVAQADEPEQLAIGEAA